MQSFLATSDKQLGICLKMLYAENLNECAVKIHLNQKQKVVYEICIRVDEAYYEVLKQRYKILIA